MANQRRVFKLGERIQGIIAAELLRVADPRFTLVTVTSVVVSPDMRTAKVYWMATHAEERREEIDRAFAGAQGMFRRALANELDIRFIPTLKFFYDDTIDVAAEVDKLFARIKNGADANAAVPAESGDDQENLSHEDESSPR